VVVRVEVETAVGMAVAVVSLAVVVD